MTTDRCPVCGEEDLIKIGYCFFKDCGMMTEHEPVPGTEYYGQDDNYTVPEDVMKELQEFTQRWEAEDMSEHACLEDQYEDEKEMSQWREFDSYQDFTDETAIYPAYKSLEYTALGLASEAGEYAGKIKKIIRDGNDPDKQEALIAELGDVLWYVAQAAASLGVHLSDVAQMNVEKLKSRKDRGKIGGSGDDR
jgi:NTP pyrophosphatase (non-canonical NTP hydrolase)